jgi:cell division protein FtsB
MTQSSIPMSARPGQAEVSGERRVARTTRQRAAQTARRRWLILCAVVVVVVVGILANIGPLSHIQDATARLEKATAKVDGLQTQKADLQKQLAKLSETGYVETLARQELAYSRPGEDLYIVTDDAGGLSAANGPLVPGVGSSELGFGAVISTALDPVSKTDEAAKTTSQTSGATAGTAGDSASGTANSQTGDAATGQATVQPPGFFERIISAIRGVF